MPVLQLESKLCSTLTSRPGACGGLCWYSRGRACCCSGCLSHLPYFKKAPAGGTALCTLCPLLKSVPADGRDENGIGSLSSQGGDFAPATVEEALTEEQTISPLCPRLPSDPCPHLVSVHAICPCDSMAQYFCVLSWERGRVSKEEADTIFET